MNKGCESYELMISRKLDNDLSESEEAALREHLRTCPECRALADALVDVTLSMRGDIAEPPEALASAVMERIEAYDAAPKRRPIRPWAKVLIAASLALAISVGGFAAWVGTWRMGSSSAADGAVMEEAIEEDVMMQAAVAEAPAVPMPEAAPTPVEAPQAAAPRAMAEPGDAGAGHAAASATAADEDRAPHETVYTAEAETAWDAETLSRLVATNTLDSPALVPEGQETSFEALLADAGIAPGDGLTVFSYVEYRGVIYEFSTDGERLIWRDAAEGFPTVSPAPVEAFLDIFT